MTKRLYKQIIFLITFTILCLAILLRLEFIFSLIKLFFAVIAPVFIGVAIAFILNKPLNHIKKILTLIFKNRLSNKKVHIIALITTYLAFFAVVCVIVACLIPQLAKSLQSLYQNLDEYSETLSRITKSLYTDLKIDVFSGINFEQTLDSLTKMLKGLSKSFFPQLFRATSVFFSGIINLSVGFVLSFYILADKPHLKQQVKLFILAWLPLKQAKKLLRTGTLASHTFSSFISGQFTEIIILAVLCFVGMNIFGFKYPLLISIIIGITNVIPIIGPFLGTIPSAFILLMDKPISAVWFVVFIIVLQQIECNFIYPRVVGSQMGLPALWVAVGVVAGGGLFGIWGMAISLPIVTILYNIMRDSTQKRLAVKFRKQQKDV